MKNAELGFQEEAEAGQKSSSTLVPTNKSIVFDEKHELLSDLLLNFDFIAKNPAKFLTALRPLQFTTACLIMPTYDKILPTLAM